MKPKQLKVKTNTTCTWTLDTLRDFNSLDWFKWVTHQTKGKKCLMGLWDHEIPKWVEDYSDYTREVARYSTDPCAWLPENAAFTLLKVHGFMHQKSPSVQLEIEYNGNRYFTDRLTRTVAFHVFHPSTSKGSAT